MPRMLANGNIVIFDNGRSIKREYSRVIELNPATREIVWEYKGNPLQSFYTESLGSAQRLPNGNTLICEGENGHVFEVTEEGEKVWEWFNPNLDDKGKRGTAYRMIRYPGEKIEKIMVQNE